MSVFVVGVFVLFCFFLGFHFSSLGWIEVMLDFREGFCVVGLRLGLWG